MHRAKCPERLWDYGLEYTSQIREWMARPLTHDRTPLELLTGITPDISEYLPFDFYGWVKYQDVRGGGTENDIGRWLGVAENIGQGMCYYVLKENRKIIAQSKVRPLTREEWLDETERTMRHVFDKQITKINSQFDETLIHNAPNKELLEPPNADDDINSFINEKANTMAEITPGPNEFVNAEVYLCKGDRNEIA